MSVGVSLAEALAAQAALLAVEAHPRRAPCDGIRHCRLRHVESRNDGWGAQHIRRALLFVHAMQLGCEYEHTPLAAFNENSRLHRVSRASAEHFFGMHTLGCMRPNASRTGNGGSGGSPPQTQLPPRRSRSYECSPVLPQDQPEADASSPAPHEIAQCGTTLGTIVKHWARSHEGPVACTSDYGVPGMYAVSECHWLRAVATLRARYLQVHRDRPPLPWFTQDAPIPRRAGLVPRRAGLGPLLLHAAVHIRRGDVLQRAPLDAGRERYVSSPDLHCNCYSVGHLI